MQVCKKYFIYCCIVLLAIQFSACSDSGQPSPPPNSDTGNAPVGNVDDSAKKIIDNANQKIRDSATE